MKSFSSRKINHPFFGWSCIVNQVSPPSASYSVNRLSIPLGHGQKVFDKASQLLNRFMNVNSLKWIEIHTTSDDNAKPPLISKLRPNDSLCTLARCRFVWVLNPCRVIAADYQRRIGGLKTTQIAFSTLDGHLLAGEEKFRVTMCEKSGEVVFDMYSFSRPANIFGFIALPYVRWVQGRFFIEQAAVMRRMMQ